MIDGQATYDKKFFAGRHPEPKTIQMVITMLMMVHLPRPTNEALMAISRNCGARFRRNLAMVANRDQGHEQAREYLQSLCEGMTAEVIAGLCALKIDVSLDDMVHVAERDGTTVAHAVQTALGDGDAAAAARRYLGAKFQSFHDPVLDPFAKQSLDAVAAPALADPPSVRTGAALAPAVDATPAVGPNVVPLKAVDSPVDERSQHHVYGGKAALTWQVDVTRGGKHTVRLEGAPSVGVREYDWKKKIGIQLGITELPMLLAVIWGYLPRIEGKRAVAGVAKGFSVERQEQGFFVKMSMQGGGAVAVPMNRWDALWVSTLVLQQCLKNAPGISETAFIASVKMLAKPSHGPAQ